MTGEAKCKQQNFTYNCMKIETGLEKNYWDNPPAPPPPKKKILLPLIPHSIEFPIPSMGSMDIFWNYTFFIWTIANTCNSYKTVDNISWIKLGVIPEDTQSQQRSFH